ncbi:MAG: aldehyde ferredoxin oxidoreductase C-terminal domain-containing protein, partial [Bacillota bacterium]|nr:aldehyde ferredoxin oxidoreductase C-terminal domain-containing protein [Bacillota bacterium]
RSNFGGRFSAMLKYAGWDGIVIEGKAEKPVWINIVNDHVAIEDASGLWGLDTWETQEEIWRIVTGSRDFRDWIQAGTVREAGRTTQRPAVLCIGPAGEHLNRNGCLVHDAGNGAGQGGFGGVWGSKNLKAISVLGTRSVEIADPNALIEARRWFASRQYNVDAPARPAPKENFAWYGIINRSPSFGPLSLPITEPSRPQGCAGCYIACRRRTQSGDSNESQCVESLYYTVADPKTALRSTDLLQRYGLNVYDVRVHPYLRELYKMGVLGPGKQINTDLPFDKYGTMEFIAAYSRAIAYREGIGADLAEGIIRAAKKWGRLEKDLDTGLLPFPNWGYHEHYDPRLEVEWSYGSILGDRDINEHCVNWYVHWMPTVTAMAGEAPLYPAEKMVEIIAQKLVPYKDPAMLDYSVEGIYSEGKAKMIAWHRHYTRFWKQSLLYCDWAWPDLVNINVPDLNGTTPEAEPKFFNAVTGKNLTFEQGMEMGRKIWNLDRSIWVLQGRHRDLEVHSGYVYKVPTKAPYWLPVYEDGQWKYSTCEGRVLDRKKFEEWKTKYYKLEGWDTSTGWPTRSTLEELGLKKVADELERNGKLGK